MHHRHMQHRYMHRAHKSLPIRWWCWWWWWWFAWTRVLVTKVKTLADFNHVFSNIGYIAFGFIFLILVRWYLNWKISSVHLRTKFSLLLKFSDISPPTTVIQMWYTQKIPTLGWSKYFWEKWESDEFKTFQPWYSASFWAFLRNGLRPHIWGDPISVLPHLPHQSELSIWHNIHVCIIVKMTQWRQCCDLKCY